MNHLYGGALLRLIRREVDVCGGLTLEDKERLPGYQHRSTPKSVQQLHLVRIDVRDDLDRGDLRFEPARLLESQPLEHDASGLEDGGLGQRGHLEQPHSPLATS